MDLYFSNATNVLVVEDSEEDFVALSRSLKHLSFNGNVFHCFDGDEALDFVFHQGEYQDKQMYPTPSIILLDLNLPGTDGREVLDIIKTNEEFKLIPIVVFTTSSNPEDIKTCYQRGANSYVLKPMSMKKMRSTIENLFIHWFEVTVLPAKVL